MRIVFGCSCACTVHDDDEMRMRSIHTHTHTHWLYKTTCVCVAELLARSSSNACAHKQNKVHQIISDGRLTNHNHMRIRRVRSTVLAPSTSSFARVLHMRGTVCSENLTDADNAHTHTRARADRNDRQKTGRLQRMCTHLYVCHRPRVRARG